VLVIGVIEHQYHYFQYHHININHVKLITTIADVMRVLEAITADVRMDHVVEEYHHHCHVLEVVQPIIVTLEVKQDLLDVLFEHLVTFEIIHLHHHHVNVVMLMHRLVHHHR
jgi:hypothetical protein